MIKETIIIEDISYIWYRYDEIYNVRTIVISEDFIKTNILYSELRKLLKAKKITIFLIEKDF